MFEELYEPLPDRGLYFKKIGLDEPADDEPRDKALIDRIVYAHQIAIPFENLDIFDRKINVPIGISAIFDKVIRGRRGGYCFELNALLHALLEELGYDVTPCVGRSLKDRGYVYPFTHRAIVVEVDGQRLFCDVGYGGPIPPCAIPLVDGHEVSACGQAFRIERGEGNWWKLFYLGSSDALAAARAAGEPDPEAVPVTAFLDEPMQLTDYAVLSHFCATSPLSMFTQHRMVNRRTVDGNVSITGDEFTRVTPEGKEIVRITSESQFQQLLRDEFGIVME